MPRVLLALVATAVLLTGCAPRVGVVGTVVAPHPATSTATTPPAVAVVRSWDARRSDAWARGDPAALRSLYVPGSTAGARDVAMLRAWTARGLRVTGLTTQLLSVDELRRTPTRWRLRVTDRLAGGRAVGRDLATPLPDDRASTHTVVLQRWAGEWRVATVS